jgi:hypothetical protein
MLPIAVADASLTGQEDQSDPKQEGKGLAQNTGRSTELLKNKNVAWLTVDILH